MIKNLLVYLLTLLGTFVPLLFILFISKAGEGGIVYIIFLGPVFCFLTYRLANKLFNKATKKTLLLVLTLGLLSLLIFIGLLAELGRSLQKQFNTTGGNKQQP